MNSNVVLEIQDVTYGFDRPLVKDLNVSLSRGESVAIVGRSGCGKTTLLNVILGFAKPIDGTVQVSGHNIHRLKPKELADVRRSHIGMVFQHGELLPGFTAIENVAIPRFLGDKTDDSALADARTLLERLEVEADTLAENLSGGERSRVALARSLINSPSLLLADEPTGSLDPEMRDEALALLLETAQALNCATMIVTHDPAVASKTGRTLRLDNR